MMEDEEVLGERKVGRAEKILFNLSFALVASSKRDWNFGRRKSLLLLDQIELGCVDD